MEKSDGPSGQEGHDVAVSDHLRLRTAMIERGGIARYTELLMEVGRRRLEAGCRAGIIVRAGRGVYLDPGLDEHLKTRAETGGVLSHLSAASRHGWSLKKTPAEAHITLRRNARTPQPSGLAPTYYFRRLADDESVDHVTEPARTVLDCARDLPFDEALTVADSALRAGAITTAEVQALARLVHGPGSRRARAVLSEATGDAANPLESVLRAICIAIPGLDVQAQYPIETASQRATVDLADPELRLVIEAEGYESHGTRNGFDNDCARYTALTCAGWMVVRFTWTQVMHRPEWVNEHLVRARDLRSAAYPLPA